MSLAPFWSGYCVVVKSDSQVAAAILNKGSSRYPMIVAWIRHLFWLKEYFNFSLFVEHIPGLADSVSLLDDVRHWKEFQAWLFKSSTSRDLKPHMSALSLALLRSKGLAATGSWSYQLPSWSICFHYQVHLHESNAFIPLLLCLYYGYQHLPHLCSLFLLQFFSLFLSSGIRSCLPWAM